MYITSIHKSVIFIPLIKSVDTGGRTGTLQSRCVRKLCLTD